MRSGRALCQFPFVPKQQVEIAVVPLDRVARPGTFDAAGNSVTGFTGTMRTRPTKPLFLDGSAFGLGADM